MPRAGYDWWDMEKGGLVWGDGRLGFREGKGGGVERKKGGVTYESGEGYICCAEAVAGEVG